MGFSFILCPVKAWRRATLVWGMVAASALAAVDGRAQETTVPHTPLVLQAPVETHARPGEVTLKILSGTVWLRVSQLPGDWLQNREDFLPRWLEENGYVRQGEVSVSVALLETAPKTPATTQGLWVKAKTPGRDIHRWLLLTDWSPQATALVQADFTNLSPEAEQVLSGVFQTLRLDKARWFSPFLALGYGFEEPVGFKPARSDGRGVVYTLSGKFPSPGEALWLVTREPVTPATGLPQQRLKNLGGYETLMPGESGQLDAPARPVWAVATARQVPQGVDVFLFAGVVVKGAEGFWMFGECPISQSAACQKNFLKNLGGFWLQE